MSDDTPTVATELPSRGEMRRFHIRNAHRFGFIGQGPHPLRRQDPPELAEQKQAAEQKRVDAQLKAAYLELPWVPPHVEDRRRRRRAANRVAAASRRANRSR